MRYWEQNGKTNLKWKANYRAWHLLLSNKAFFLEHFHSNSTTGAWCGRTWLCWHVLSDRYFKDIASFDGQQWCNSRLEWANHNVGRLLQTENTACQWYQSCVSRRTRKTDGVNKSNTMQGHASCLSNCVMHSPATTPKCPSQHASSSFLCGPVIIIYHLFLLLFDFTNLINLSSHHYGCLFQMGQPLEAMQISEG